MVTGSSPVGSTNINKNTMKNNWLQSGSSFMLREVSRNVKTIDPGIYRLDLNPTTNELFLTLIKDKFDFPYKIYGIEKGFVDRVVKSYQNTEGNLGALLVGVRGTGKTVTAKQISNRLNLPVILINEAYDDIPKFINEIQQDVVIFIDEFEKVFSDRDHSVLTVMDGVLDNGFRRTFLLTTNYLYVNENLLQRPSRIRYVKHYKNLSLENILEIVEDTLLNKEYKDQVIEYISGLELVTVDIVKAVVQEVNIHNEPPEVFKDVFNAIAQKGKVDVFKIEYKDGEIVKELVESDAFLDEVKFSSQDLHSGFYINSKFYGTIINIVDDNIIICQNEKNNVITKTQYLIEPKKSLNKVFYGYGL